MKRLFTICAIGLFSVLVTAQEVKQARNNDVASKYTLKSNGDLFRTVNGKECQVTNNVQSFKISQHPNDVAMIYFEKDNDLYILRNADRSGSCPKADKKVLMSSVKKYTVTSTKNTKIVNIALSNHGVLTAWNNSSSVLSESSIQNYSHNNCYGVDGKSFSTYVAFAITYRGEIIKIRGGNDGKAIQAVKHSGYYYREISDFTRDEEVCR